MLRKKSFKLLKAIKENQQSRLGHSFSKACLKSCSRGMGNILLKRFKAAGLVKTIKCGRKLTVKLTNKGEEVLKSLEVINNGTN